jgi:hypothetical protein
MAIITTSGGHICTGPAAMIIDQTLIPEQLRKGPAAGFLCLTEYLVFFRLADSQNTTDWKSVEQCLENLDRALREYLACEELDPDLARELIIHRDRVTLTLDSWQKGTTNTHAFGLAVKHERLLRQQQRIWREEAIRERRDCVERTLLDL